MEGSEVAEIDCSAGTLVWVRRRNGSWWPGRILAAEEVAESHLMSPRSGTPVKLLGREDASVDWYNLEKSKRVKAFRCGEFDECIEKAEAVHGSFSKKSEKYARREDAIHHALDLEKQLIQNSRVGMEIDSSHLGVNHASLSDNHYENSEPAGDLNFENLLAFPAPENLSPSFEDEDVAKPLFSGEENLMNERGFENGKSEMVQRMRGLTDFGLGTDFSKEKLPAPDTFADAGNFKVSDHNNNSKSSSATKRKRSENGPSDETVVKKRDRRRPLVKVLQSSAKLASFVPSTSHEVGVSIPLLGETVGPVLRAQRSKCVYFPVDNNVSKEEFPLLEMQVADRDNGFEFDSSKDGDEIFLQTDHNDQNLEITTGSPLLSVKKPSQSESNSPNDQILETEELDGSMSSHSSQPHLNEPAVGLLDNMGGSKWKSKGKRNMRFPLKRPTEVPDANNILANETLTNQASVSGSKINTVKKRSSQRATGGVLQGRKDDPIYDYYNDDEEENDDECDQVNADDGSRELRSDDESFYLDDETIPGVIGHWGEPDEYSEPYYAKSFNMTLVDVDLKVQVSNKREQVPLVSLMSRLNGKAIIGHPLQVEKVKEGFSQTLLRQYDVDDHFDGCLQTVWPTARRTAMNRVPRPHPAAADDIGDPNFAPGSKMNVDFFDNKGRPIKKSNSQSHGSFSDKKNSKKQSKKSSSASQKTRTLSSISVEKRLANPALEVKGNLPAKQEGSIPNVCVPVKLVFSRINKALEKIPSSSLEKEQL